MCGFVLACVPVVAFALVFVIVFALVVVVVVVSVGVFGVWACLSLYLWL